MSKSKTYVNNSSRFSLDLSSNNASDGFSSSFRDSSRVVKAPRAQRTSSSVGSARQTQSQGYVYGNAAPALLPEFQPEKKRQTRRTSETSTSSISKQISREKNETRSSFKRRVVVTFASFVLLFGAIGFVNITLTSMTVASSTQAQSLSTQISQERENGKSLEVEYGLLSNPATVKEKALAIGMESPTNVIQISLAQDSVLTKDDGSIALSSTLKAVANQ